MTMGLRWRRAFCTASTSDESEPGRIRSRLGGFLSNPTTPRPPPSREEATVVSFPLQSVKLQCKTRISSRFFHSSAPSSPRSPSTFSLLKSSLRLTKSRCGVCLKSVKTDGRTAIFTAECGHSFHFPCISSHVVKKNKGSSLVCSVCSYSWKEMNLLNDGDRHKLNLNPKKRSELTPADSVRCSLKAYNDDEPLSSPISGCRFYAIPESDETEEEGDEFQGLSVSRNEKSRNIEITLSPEVAVVSDGRASEIYAAVLKIKAPASATRRDAIDLVTVLDVSRNVTLEKLHLMKRSMRLIVSSLTAADRLSIVAFSTTSKRLLSLRRMTTTGKNAARRIIDAVIALDCHATSSGDSIKKAAKVIEDRRERNPAASILLFSNGHLRDLPVSSSRFANTKIPVHSFSLSACVNALPEYSIARSINSIICTAIIQELKIRLSSTNSFKIPVVYSLTGRPAIIGNGSAWFPAGDFHSEEEKEFLLELKLQSSSPLTGSHRFLSVRCSYKDPSTQQPKHDKEQSIQIPRPRSSQSSSAAWRIQRLKCLYFTTRAVAESRRLVERNDIAGAHHILVSARELVLQSDDELARRLEDELSQLQTKRRNEGEIGIGLDDIAEPYTPTSAWRAAERLAKLAIMKKSLNRVSDLHGFEDARF